MAKYGNISYLELPRKIFTDEYRGLSKEAKWLYVVLKELEHRYTGSRTDGSFFKSDKDLSSFSGIKLTTMKKAKKELTESGLIETKQSCIEKDGKKTKRHITTYRIT